MRGSRWSLVAAAALLMGCGQLPAAPSEAVPTTAASASAPAGATAGEPVRFESPLYPYAMELPDSFAVGTWTPAASAWNGEDRIDSRGPLVDHVGVADGVLFFYGTPWTGELTEFAEHAHANGVEHHGCSERPETTQEVEIAGEPALVYTMQCSGSSVVRIAFTPDGFGMVAAEILNPDSEDDAVPRLIELLDGITWRAR